MGIVIPLALPTRNIVMSTDTRGWSHRQNGQRNFPPSNGRTPTQAMIFNTEPDSGCFGQRP